MTDNNDKTEAQGSRFRVQCEQCGVVEFDVLDEDWFGNVHAAMYYAGYHDGKKHGDSDSQESFAEEVP